MRFYTFIITLLGILFTSYSQINDYRMHGLWHPNELIPLANQVKSEYSGVVSYTSFGVEDSHVIIVFEGYGGIFIDAALFLVDEIRTERDGFPTYKNESVLMDQSNGDRIYGLPVNYDKLRRIARYDINEENRKYSIIFDDGSNITFEIDRYIGQYFYAFHIEDSIGGYLSRFGKEKLEFCNH